MTWSRSCSRLGYAAEPTHGVGRGHRRRQAPGRRLDRRAVQLDLPSWGYLFDTDMAYGTGAMKPPDWFEEGVSDPTARTGATG